MLLSLDEVVDKRWDFWRWDKNTLGWGFVVLDFLSESQGDLDDEASDSFYQNHYYSSLGNYTRTFQPSDFRLSKDTKVILGRGIHPLRSRPKSLELSIPIGAPDNFCNKAWKLSEGHMFGEAMVVDPVGAVLCIFNDPWIF